MIPCRRRKGRALLALAFGAAFAAAPGQQHEQAPATAVPEPIDSIVAVVDDVPILESEIQAAMAAEMERLGIDPSDSATVAELRRFVLDDAITGKVLYKEALARGMAVDPDELETEVQRRIQEDVERLGGEDLFMAELAREGLQRSEYEERLRERLKEKMLIERFIQAYGNFGTEITPEDVRAYYEEVREDLPQRQPAVHLEHIVIAARPDSNAYAARLQTVQDLARRIRSGEISFEEAARRFSDDASGREGGSLGRVTKGEIATQLGEQTEKAIFSLEPGQVSDPIQSPLGWHLFTLDAKDEGGQWVEVRHILIAVPVMRADEARAEERAREVCRRIRAGERFGDLAREYSDDPEGAASGGDLGWLPMDALGEGPLRDAVEGLKMGEVSDPIKVGSLYHIVKVLGREAGREYTFDEVKDRLEAELRQKRWQEAFTSWVEEIKKKYYIEIR